MKVIILLLIVSILINLTNFNKDQYYSEEQHKVVREPEVMQNILNK